MQYLINIEGNQAIAFIQYWDNSGVNEQGNPVIATLPTQNTLPAGWALEIALGNDGYGNVNSINLSVINDQGQPVGNSPYPMPLPAVANTNTPILAPVLAFWAVVAGLPTCNIAEFTSGGGNITYEASNLCVQGTVNCSHIAELWGVCEGSNASYGAIDPCCGTSITQQVIIP
jgi:hypothetical protein